MSDAGRDGSTPAVAAGRLRATDGVAADATTAVAAAVPTTTAAAASTAVGSVVDSGGSEDGDSGDEMSPMRATLSERSRTLVSAAAGQPAAQWRLCAAGWVALRAFAAAVSVLLFAPAAAFVVRQLTVGSDSAGAAGAPVNGDGGSSLWPWVVSAGGAHVCFVHCALLLRYSSFRRGPPGLHFDYPIVWRAAMLGSACGISLLTACLGPASVTTFALYGVTLSIFHFSEYLVTACINPRYLNLSCFLLNHSKEYDIALIAGWLEYFIELYLWPDLKLTGVVACCGVVFCVAGELLRKCAMFTAGSNFNHLIRTKREEDHRLVTTGVYSICRHPSYAGWFMWSVGTQLLLANPVCLVAYTMVTWMYFRERVEDEEITLLEFFGEEYADYQRRVATGLPFIKGFKMEL